MYRSMVYIVYRRDQAPLPSLVYLIPNVALLASIDQPKQVYWRSVQCGSSTATPSWQLRS